MARMTKKWSRTVLISINVLLEVWAHRNIVKNSNQLSKKSIKLFTLAIYQEFLFFKPCAKEALVAAVFMF